MAVLITQLSCCELVVKVFNGYESDKLTCITCSVFTVVIAENNSKINYVIINYIYMYILYV